MNTEESTAFIREKIKERPINKRKLFRRTVLTAVLAIVFGGVACLSFLVLEPFFSARIAQEEPQIITFPALDDEIRPEDLYADDQEIVAAQEQVVAESIQASIEASEQDRINAAVASAISRMQLDKSDAGELYHSLKQVATEASRSLVLVRCATTADVFVGGTIERSGEKPGLIVADNGVEMLILTYTSILEDGSELSVTWKDGHESPATCKMADEDTGLCVLSVPKRFLESGTQAQIAPAPLGSSASRSLTGTPVIATGSPAGIYASLCYGMIVSEKLPVDRIDKALKVYATDIYGGGESAGFLLNYTGQVIGMIYPEPVAGVDENRIIAYSITELKRLIEHLVNGTPIPYAGIHGASITGDIAEILHMTEGACVLGTEMGSPAMTAGLQSGDIIVSCANSPVESWDAFAQILSEQSPGDELSLEIRRQGPAELLSLQLTIPISEVTQ